MDTVTNTYKLVSEYKLWSLSHEEMLPTEPELLENNCRV